MTRLERLQAILIHLQSKKIVTAQEIADRFEISIRTVYRDLRSLEEAGVPIGAEAGIGYFLTDNFHLPPVMFTKQEASALLLGAKFIDHLTDANTKTAVESALMKIKSVLQTDTKEHINQLHEHISVYGSYSNNSCDLHLQSIQKSLAECRKANIDYTTTNNKITTNRKIVPLSLCFYGYNWHLIAFCELRNSYRDFRLDRIQKYSIDNECFCRKNYKTVAEYFASLDIKNEDSKIIMQVNKAYAKYIKDYKYWYGFTHEVADNNFIEMHFYNNDFDGFARWVLYGGDNYRIIHPPLLQEKVRMLVQQLCNWYNIEKKE